MIFIQLFFSFMIGFCFSSWIWKTKLVDIAARRKLVNSGIYCDNGCPFHECSAHCEQSGQGGSNG